MAHFFAFSSIRTERPKEGRKIQWIDKQIFLAFERMRKYVQTYCFSLHDTFEHECPEVKLYEKQEMGYNDACGLGDAM